MADSRRLGHVAECVPTGDPPLAIVVDALGRICDCGATIEQLFRTSREQMIGRPVSAFIVGVLFEGCSLGETARQLARLCAEHDWQEFTALDVHGHSFPIEIYVTREMNNSLPAFVFNLRRLSAN
jgi:hypothetical protein